MEFMDRVPGRTIPASGEMTWFQKYYAWVAFLIASVTGIAGGIYIAFILGPDIPEMQASGIVLMVLMPIAGFFTSLLLAAALQRGAWPIILYKDGIEFHQFTFDRLIRHGAFVPVSDLEKVRVFRFIDTRSSDQTSRKAIMNFITVRKAEYGGGQRAEQDIQQALEYIRKEWPTVSVVEETISSVDGRRVVMPEPTAISPARARKVSVQPTYDPMPPATYEPRSVQPSYQPPMPPPYQTPVPAAPTMSFCPSCGAGVISGARFCPACGHQFGPSVQRPGMPLGEGKSTQVALLLSLLPGLAGFLGLGHFYVHKYAKGTFLLVMGFFFAGMGFVSVLMLSDPATIWSAGALIVSLFFNLLFLMMLIYSVIDARKGAAEFNFRAAQSANKW